MTNASIRHDWNPQSYARFHDLRLRPGLDLLNAVDRLGPGDVIDLGCGNGALCTALKARAPGHRVIGFDGSPSMLKQAQEQGYDGLQQGDIKDWRPLRPPALIFSNAALHWLPNHREVLPRLASFLAKGGTLAVQMPHQNNAPSHRVWTTLAEDLFPGRNLSAGTPGVKKPVDYEELLSPLGHFRLWETEYYQRLGAEQGSHPVRRYTEATYARPILAALEPQERDLLIERYEEVMNSAYPVRADGSVLFPFRRMFFVLTV